MPDLAVIMSVYYNDRLDYVRESVQSILNQTYSDFDFFISFDGPVRKEVDNYISKLNDQRIRLFRIEKNGGLANALNLLLKRILKNQDYRYIARMDADDISLPDRFLHQREFLGRNSEISCVGTWYEEVNEAGSHLAFRKVPVDHKSIRKRYIMRAPFPHSSVMFRRKMIEKAGFYPTDTLLMEDNVLWGNVLKCGMKFANLPEYLHKYRKNERYYERRSGLKYGLKFIKTRFKIIREVRLPVYSYVVSFIVGIVKIMPVFVLRKIYLLSGKI